VARKLRGEKRKWNLFSTWRIGNLQNLTRIFPRNRNSCFLWGNIFSSFMIAHIQTSDSISEPPWFLNFISLNMMGFSYFVNKNSCLKGTSSVLLWLLISKLQTVFQNLTWIPSSLSVLSDITFPLHRFPWKEEALPKLFSCVYGHNLILMRSLRYEFLTS